MASEVAKAATKAKNFQSIISEIRFADGYDAGVAAAEAKHAELIRKMRDVLLEIYKVCPNENVSTEAALIKVRSVLFPETPKLS